MSNNTASTDPMRLNSLFVLEDGMLDADNETVSPSFILDVSIMSDTEHLISTFQKSNKNVGNSFLITCTLIS